MAEEIISAENIPFNFTYYAMKLLGKNLYSNPWTAISELVANGIDSKAKNVHVLVDMREKQNAVIEIFDDGCGMTYDDLCNKYTVIGRDKRHSTDNIEGKTLGRKGIGKLAALYLSPEYCIYTKQSQGESAWKINTLQYTDSDFPSLNRIIYDTKDLLSHPFWERQKSGTLLHLSKVDLRKIGEERLKRLSASLADYYLDTVIDCKILICILQNSTDELVFSEVKKNICYETLYSIFDNTGNEYKSRLLPKVYLTKGDIRPEVDIPRDTIVLDEDKYACRGDITLTDLSGVERTVPYELKGWIGIQSSLDNDILVRNSPKGKKIRPNSLRLYVRGKLAVDNLMTYIKSTQAFASYIEGEISFDILDEDIFEDASTSSREGYTLSDPRVLLLVDITKKIVRGLINERTEIGNQINGELRALAQKDAQRKAEAEEAARKAAEAQKKAERNEEEARNAQRQAEAETKVVKQEVNHYKEQNRVIFSTVSEDQESFAAKCHLVKTNAVAIRNGIKSLGRKIGEENYKEVGAIAISAERILSSLKYSALATFNMRDEFINEDIALFIDQFINKVMTVQYHAISFTVDRHDEVTKRFSPQNLALIFDNLISNSQKSNSTQIVISLAKKGSNILIVYQDDGAGFAEADDLKKIFEFGWSNTGGTGIGLYNVQRAVTRMNGRVVAERVGSHGAKFIIEL